MLGRRFIIAILSTVMMGLLMDVATAAPPSSPPPNPTGRVYAPSHGAPPQPGFFEEHGWWYLGPGVPLNRMTSTPPTFAVSPATGGGPNPSLGPPPLLAGPPPVYAAPPPLVLFGISF